VTPAYNLRFNNTSTELTVVERTEVIARVCYPVIVVVSIEHPQRGCLVIN